MSGAIEVVGVVVPARDEAQLLPAALASLAVAAERARRTGVVVDLVLVADSCTDATAALGRAAGLRVLEVSVGAVGPARAHGMYDVLARHRDLDRRGFWLATTDADSTVPAHWLTCQLDLAAGGADLVLGTVAVEDWAGHPPHVEHAWRAAYDSRDGHAHVHGANVGARADAYLAAGGFPSLDRDEDVALVCALSDRRVVRTGAIPVVTSSRARSRVTGGFADHLAGLA